MIVLKDEQKIPLQVYLRQVIATLKDDEEFGLQVLNFSYSVETVTAAIMVCSIIPVLIFYPFIQKYFNKGIMLGGVKE
jgi:putative aldouronate transport system permease protein